MSYQTYAKIRDAHGLRDADVIKATGITKSTFSEWKKGTYQPKDEKRKKIADYFGVSLEYLDTGDEESYYLNPETAKLAQEINWHKKRPFWSSGTRPERATIIL